MNNPIFVFVVAMLVFFVGFTENTLIATILYGYFGIGAFFATLFLLACMILSNDKLYEVRELYTKSNKKEQAPTMVSVPALLGSALIFSSAGLYFFTFCSIVLLLFYQADSWFYNSKTK